MGGIFRGMKNAFRNSVRTISVVLILALSIGLSLVMFLASRTVDARIANIKSTIGNTITISPAGSQGFEGGGEPLTLTQIASVKKIDHVSSVSSVLLGRLTKDENTSLTSSIEPGTLGNRRNNAQVQQQTSGRAPSQPRTFVLPIIATGVESDTAFTTGSVKLTSGTTFDGTAGKNVAVLGQALATKNSLKVGSIFTAYDTTLTVVGIFDAGNEFTNSSLYLPLGTLQRVSSQPDEISSATVQTDSIENIDTAVAAIKTKLGADKADVVSGQDNASQALEPLQNIKNISVYSLFGSLGAGAIITLLTMVMIVRERRKEIGVLKAIGASNITVTTQFVAESLVLTFLGSIVGVVLGFFLSNPILSALVTSSGTAAQTAGPQGGPGGGGARGFFMSVGQIGQGENFRNALEGLHATVGLDILLYGFLAAIIIAVLGSAIPSWLIAKVRPAEVIRGE